MDRFLRFNFSIFSCRTPRNLLAISWIGGLILGAVIVTSADTLLFPTMRTAIFGCMSISGLLVSVLLPLLFTAFAVYYSQIWLIFLIAFLKAFLFSFVGTGILVSFHGAAWLIRDLFLFRQTLTIPFLWYLWMCLLSDNRRKALGGAILTGIGILLIGCVDYVFIEPFLMALISL